MAFRLDSGASSRHGVNGSGRRRQAACGHRSFLKSTCWSSPVRKNGSTSRRGPSVEPASKVHQEPAFGLPLHSCTPSRRCFHSHCRPKETNTCFHHDNVATECCCVSFCVFFFVLLLHCVQVCTVQILKCILTTIVTWPKVNFNHLRKKKKLLSTLQQREMTFFRAAETSVCPMWHFRQ